MAAGPSSAVFLAMREEEQNQQMKQQQQQQQELHIQQQPQQQQAPQKKRRNQPGTPSKYLITVLFKKKHKKIEKESLNSPFCIENSKRKGDFM